MKLFIAVLWVVYATVCLSANDPSNVPTPAPVLCPAATELMPQHLYGLWRAEFSDPEQNLVTGRATVLFEQDPDFAQSVSGAVVRGDTKALVSGDTEEGEFTLEESVDGVNISSTWSGTVVPDACGKEIRGTWTDILHRKEIDFVLRKMPQNGR